jgi:serine/threonine protein phosphatase PrpC
VGKNGRVK